MLTNVQRICLDFLGDFLRNNKGVAPSHEEIAGALGLHSKSGVNRILVALEERGFIRRIPQRARAIEILKNPHAHDSAEKVCNDLPVMMDRCMRVGLFATAHLMHEAVRKSGWELAELKAQDKKAIAAIKTALARRGK